jgi:hypothetical protein
VRCPYCGGWHYGYGTPPPVNYRPRPIDLTTANDILWNAMRTISEEARKDPYERDVLPEGSQLWGPRIYGTDERGEEVTVAFGRPGTTKEDHAMISDGHVTGWKFYVPDDQGVKGHDHIGPDPSPDKQRGRYSGWDGFHDPE